MSYTFIIEDYVRQRLGDRETEDYFPGEGELNAICWRHVVCRDTRATIQLSAIESRMTPLPSPGISSAGSFWIYPTSYYIPSVYRVLELCCSFDQWTHQENHKYGFFEANAYLDDVFMSSQPEIDEIALTVHFDTVQTGVLTLTGHVININRLMNDIFTAIADDIAKLAIYQSTLGGATDLRDAKRIAREEAQAWLQGSRIKNIPMKGTRR